uniref:BPTI/Kunitz inhibitor domain-containing protein n=1 Tax=Angiostrongylus cantonensis TaxID=6313 RepID=A0A0K0CT05_ANGCA
MFATSGTSASFGKQTSKCMFSVLREAERANIDEPEHQRHSDHPHPPQRVLREIIKGQTTKKTGHTIGMEAKLTKSREDGMRDNVLTLSEIEVRLAALRGCDVELIRRPRCIFESAERSRPTGDAVQGLLKEASDLVEINDRHDPVTELERRHKRLREEGEQAPHSTKSVVKDDFPAPVDGFGTDTEGQRLSKVSTTTAFSEATAKELEEINRKATCLELLKDVLFSARQKSLELEEVNRKIGQFWDKRLEKECVSESEDESVDEETVKKIILEADQITNEDSLHIPSMGICCANRTELILLYGLDSSAHADPIWERPCSPEETTVMVSSTDIPIGESPSSTDELTAPSTFTPINERESTYSPTSTHPEHRNNSQQLQDGGTDFDNELSETNGDILKQMGSASREIVITTDVIDSKSGIDREENKLTIDERTTKTEPNHMKVLTRIAGENEADILGELKVIPAWFPIPASLPLENVMESQKRGTQTFLDNEMEKEQNIGFTTISPMDVNLKEEDNHVDLEVKKKDMEVTENAEMLQQTTREAKKVNGVLSEAEKQQATYSCGRRKYKFFCRSGKTMTQPTIRWYLNENGHCEYYPWGYCPGDRVVQSSTIRTKADCERECKPIKTESTENIKKPSNIGSPVDGAAISIGNDTEFNRTPIELAIKSNHTEEEHGLKEAFSDNKISNESTMELVTVARLDSAGNSTNSDDGLHKLEKQKTVSDIKNDSEEEVLTSQLIGNLSVNDSLLNEKSSTDGLESISEIEAISTDEEAPSGEALSKGQQSSINNGSSSALGNSEDQLTTPNVMANVSEEVHSTTSEGEVVHVNTEEQTSTEPSSNAETKSQLKSNLLEELPNESECDEAEMKTSSMTSSTKAMLDGEEAQKGHDEGALE